MVMKRNQVAVVMEVGADGGMLQEMDVAADSVVVVVVHAGYRSWMNSVWIGQDLENAEMEERVVVEDWDLVEVVASPTLVEL